MDAGLSLFKLVMYMLKPASKLQTLPKQHAGFYNRNTNRFLSSLGEGVGKYD